VVGDIVKIKGGMNIPVDGVVIIGSGVSVTEAAMTGESDELKKEAIDTCKMRREEKESEYAYHKDPKRGHHDIPSPVLLSGTQIVTGEGWFVVVVVGKHSCVGKIMAKLEQKIETTPLQEKLEAIGSDIGKLGMYCALLTIHILFLRFFIVRFVGRDFDLFGGEQVMNKYGTSDGSLKQYC
jgi:magnesium-transporting ATPase (P-type)